MAGRPKKPRPPKPKDWGRVPTSYAQTVREMQQICINWMRDKKPMPRFTLPHRDVAVFGSLDQYAACVTRNTAALELVQLFIKIGHDVGGASPTMLMLEAALEVADMPFERVSLEQLGIPKPTVN